MLILCGMVVNPCELLQTRVRAAHEALKEGQQGLLALLWVSAQVKYIS